MAKYLFEASYSPEGVKGIADKGGSARREAVEQLFQGAGGQLEGFYFALGDNDIYAFGELPSVEAATAVALTVNASGMVKLRTVALLTPEEVDSAAEQAIEYRPPGS
jgi:uncharacterized protein with GYD domain